MNTLKQKLQNINWLYIAQVICLVVLFTVPTLAFAQLRANDTTLCSGTGLNCQSTSVNQLIRTVINWILGITFGIAVLFLIIGGFWYITSAGNPEGATKGKQTVINAVIGIVIIVLSYVIVNVVANLVANNNSTTAP